MAKNHKSVKRPQSAPKGQKKPKIEDKYIRGMVLDIIVIVVALLVWAGYNHVLPHFWEIQPVYTANMMDGTAREIHMDTESKTYERYVDGELASSGKYVISGRRIKFTDTATDFTESYTMEGDYLVSVNDVFNGRMDNATKFKQTLSRTTTEGTTVFEFTKDRTYTCTVTNDAGESVTTGTYSRDGGKAPIILTQENADGTTEELQGLFVYDHKATDNYYIAQ